MNPSSSNARLRPFRPVPFGRYTLLSQLATGGMGEIFLARLEGMQGFEKLCVIKKILPQLAADPEFVERFVGEARTLVKLSHGSIAQVLDMGLQEGEAFMALEHVDGKDLRKVAARARDRNQPLPLAVVLFIMGRVLDALAYAHRKKGDDEGELNLVHRDISPQNILISYEGEVKVIDFGLAKSRLSAAKTNPSIILGKFLYMSPEQARHQPVDRRSDLYAVGLCLYELLAGKNPFDALPPGELMSAVTHPNIPPLGQVAPGVPAPVADLVMKALAVDPTQRFQTAEELRGRLSACLLELDPTFGPEGISRAMHELFDSEYLAERRLLVMLREVGRAPEPEPEVIGMPEGVAPRPPGTLPPKTIRLDGPVEALSFRPTPRTREGGIAGNDAETRPGVLIDEATRPGVPMDEPTRPAVDLEALESMRRAPPPPPPPSRGSSPMLPATPPPAPPPPPTPVNEEVLDEVLDEAPEVEPPPAIENTPTWAVPLPREEEPASDAVPSAEGGEEAPVLVGTLDLSEGDVVHDDTQPRAQMPRSPSRGSLPRVSSSDVYHQDTQPRVVLDASLLPEAEQVDESASARPRATGTKAPRRRVTATGMPAVRPAAPPRLTASGEEDATLEIPRAAPTLPEVATPRRPAKRSRAGLWVALGVLGVGGLAAGTWLWLGRPLPEFATSPRAPAPPAPRATRPPEPAAQTPAPDEEVPALAPTHLPPLTATAIALASRDGGVLADAGSELAMLSSLTAAPARDAGTPVPDAGAAEAMPLDDDLLSPLAPTPASAPTRRPPPRPKRGASRTQTVLQKEWARTRAAFQKLNRDVACENLDLVCNRYSDLKTEVEGAGDDEDTQLLGEVRKLYQDIVARRSEP
jgi:eukaryotic-like serine/threonine-protein kinase